MVRLGSFRKEHEAEASVVNQQTSFVVAIEEGVDGWRAAWCLNLPGCYTLIRDGEDPTEAVATAIAEFMSWSHQRAAARVMLDHDGISIVQTLHTTAKVGAGESHAVFAYELQPPGGKEFPLWANAHDLAHDELVDMALAMPSRLLERRAGDEGRRLVDIVRHAAEWEWAINAALAPGRPPVFPDGMPALVPAIRDAHRKLQEAVCGVPGGFHAHRQMAAGADGEDWSVRKAMRRSIWHLRYHTWELRRAISRNWLA